MLDHKSPKEQLILASNKVFENDNHSQNKHSTGLETQVQPAPPPQSDFVVALTEQKSKARGFGKKAESHIFEGVLRMLAKYGGEGHFSVAFKRRHAHHVKNELPLFRAMYPDLSFSLKTQPGTGLPILSISAKEAV